MADEETWLLAEASRHLRPMIVLALNTGMRQGEILKLRAEHVDLAGRRLTIPKENSKSKKTRQIPLNSTALELLSPLVKDQGLVFAKSGDASFRRIGCGFKAACDRAKIKDLRFHDLRHTFATRSMEGGANPANLRETLGHNSMEFTLDHYNHASWDSFLRDADLLAGRAVKQERIEERIPARSCVSPSRADN